jgi:hypothetical protein
VGFNGWHEEMGGRVVLFSAWLACSVLKAVNTRLTLGVSVEGYWYQRLWLRWNYASPRRTQIQGIGTVHATILGQRNENLEIENRFYFTVKPWTE